MKKIPDLVKKYPVVSYFLLTFAISWGGLFFGCGGPAGFPKTKEQFEALLPIFIPIVLLGPSLACLILIGLISGKKGFGKLLSQILQWRAELRWYLVALLSGPLFLLAVPLALSLFSPVFMPGLITSSEKAPLLMMGIISGIIVGIFEELGWTGFVTPRLLLRFGVLKTGFIIGILWGLWHVFLNVIWVKDVFSGGLPINIFLITRGIGDVIGILPAFRILMVWVYARTGRLPLAMIMHAGLTAATIIFQSPRIEGVSLIVYDIVSAVSMWAIVGACYLANRREFSR
jgi:hypothetical protein